MATLDYDTKGSANRNGRKARRNFGKDGSSQDLEIVTGFDNSKGKTSQSDLEKKQLAKSQGMLNQTARHLGENRTTEDAFREVESNSFFGTGNDSVAS